jgi:FkbH-like protein
VAAQRGVGRRKVAVVDLDDTLWGGVVGEVGVSGLTLGDEGVGLAFKDLQRELLKLHDAGIVLAVCTKNNAGDAEDGFTHPEMVLRREHFAADRINWQDKATNLTEIAEELNLGLDSLVFLDDNPVERDWVRQALPEVCVPELPADPVDRPAFVAEATWFQTLDVTDDDRRRAASYRTQGVRRKAQASARSFEEFLASLEQEVTLEPVHEATLARAAQLCQRTNQFNLTTRRHTLADLEAMLEDDAVELHTIAVRDRFGDSGITGVAIVAFEGEDARIDTLLLSCRVLGRRVEDALLAFLAARARARGARGLVGEFVPTERNAQVADFYPRRGFTEAGDKKWRLDLEGDLPASPPELAVVESAHA